MAILYHDLVSDHLVSYFDVYTRCLPNDSLHQFSLIAYKHGNSDYIIDTTHPTSDDYLKFVEEAQASLKSGKTRYFYLAT